MRTDTIFFFFFFFSEMRKVLIVIVQRLAYLELWLRIYLLHSHINGFYIGLLTDFTYDR